MRISVEISLYPLEAQYEAPIIAFIEQLHQDPTLDVQTNGMSTQVFGEFDRLMKVLIPAIKTTFSEEIKQAMVLKLLNTDVSGFKEADLQLS